MLTVDQLKSALPKGLQSNATQEFCDRINNLAMDPEMAREVRENFLTYATVLTEGKYKTEDYLNAVTYCTFKLMGKTNKDAYILTFPQRYTALVSRGASDKDISAYVASYHKNQLVNTILQQAFIPMWLVNQDNFQRAVNRQVYLMENAESELVQTQAANSLLTALKQPENKKIELDVKLKGGGGLDDLRDTMTMLAERQLQMIENGAGAKDIGRIPLQRRDEEIIDVTPVRVPTPARLDPKEFKGESLKALGDALETGTGMTKVTYEPEQKQVVVAHVPREEQTAPPARRPSLFEKVPEPAEVTIKRPVANYARCCDNMIEDCVCVEQEHIYLPTNEDVPRIKRVSLFDDPAGMP